ncbi:hypothetical protein CONPUDRAFT_145012 [Coniophora puteana RWD-64-598 SS2]|uniref:F-box domain-containing protein n=1 Tax=Coniophora puteana (strain RWD-64-598) TaxID=741705 RepID=A0A5M3MMB4_CONPW|nr:uncharacterized protein CONPUDRAFT_145012 [Coniophora puteana RWD-64-598 SS2]EIW79914.1 hypothetical protein CONPUDRAFT_145012 [Coniophora puteana RWD-64-598 SS2]
MLVLGRASLSLQSLTFNLELTYISGSELTESSEDFTNILVDAVQNLSHLNTLEFNFPTYPIPWRLLASISRFPSLKSLTLRHSGGAETLEGPVPIGSVSFPRLEELKVTSSRPDGVTATVSRLEGLSQIQSFDFAVKGSDIVDAAETEEMIDLVAERLSKNTTRSIRFSIDQRYTSEGGRRVLKLSTLRPLYRFEGLIELILELVSGFRVDDGSLEELSLAFPKLRHFELQDTGAVISVTLKGLAMLLRNCTALRQLTLFINATRESNLEFDKSPIEVQNMEITTLNVMWCPVDADDPGYAAGHLLRMLPCLREVQFNGWYAWIKAWAQVNDLLGKHALKTTP